MFPKVYFDEAGNTGSNITNHEQPIFVLSSVCFTDDELEQIRKDIRYEGELHFIKLKKSIDGREVIRRLIKHPLLDANHISYYVVDKAFATYAFMVDSLIEPFFKYELHENLYKGRRNITLANCLYYLAEDTKLKEVVKDSIEDLKSGFEIMMRQQSEDSIESFYETLNILISMTDNDLQEILEMMLPSREMLDVIFVEDNRYCLDITLSTLLVLTDHWHKKKGTKIDIITDNSKQLFAKQELIHQLMAIEGYHSVGYDTRKTIFPPQINNLSFVDSIDSIGVQIADIVASTVFFTITGTNKYKAFQDELKDSALLKIPCYSLMRSSAEALKKSVETNNDSDPLDFLVENLWNITNR